MPLPPPSKLTRIRRAPIAALAVAGVAMPALASIEPERASLQLRVAAVRAALADARAVDTDAAPVPATLVAQATNWTNWPKWSKWSNWANK